MELPEVEKEAILIKFDQAEDTWLCFSCGQFDMDKMKIGYGECQECEDVHHIACTDITNQAEQMHTNINRSGIRGARCGQNRANYQESGE
jgi:hypothetical protein